MAGRGGGAGVGIRLNLPYLQGAYLAFNAIPDAYFLGDGPSCLFAKAEQIHGRHDLFSTLLSPGSDHRVQYTGVNVFNIAGSAEAGIVGALRRMASWSGCGVLFFGSMPMCTIAGTDYERLLREAFPSKGKPAFLMPRRSAISGDWLDGYGGVLEALASGMDLEGSERARDSVAVVGYLMDRNEGEHRGNVRELERILEALGLRPASVWLSGRPYAHLREVRRAGAVVSLPHGRGAGRVLARRLGVRLVEAGLPFGLENTRAFVELLGREFGREDRAAAFVRRELDEVAPRLEWAVPHAFLHRRFGFMGDPHYALRFAQMMDDVGGETAGLRIMGGAHHLSEAERASVAARPDATFEPITSDADEQACKLAGGEPDLVILNSLALRHTRPTRAWLEFGFPSAHTHFLDDAPFLGFQGALGFMSRMANELVKGLYWDETRPADGGPGPRPAAESHG